jgi:Domain of unknown function (DUF5615)
VTVRFLADEDIRPGVIQALRSREPAIDILDVKSAGLKGAKDPALLEIAAEQGRILITYDRNTMTRHFWEYLAAGKSSPGVFIVPQRRSAIGEITEWLLLVWTASQAEEWCNQIVFIPSR